MYKFLFYSHIGPHIKFMELIPRAGVGYKRKPYTIDPLAYNTQLTITKREHFQFPRTPS